MLKSSMIKQGNILFKYRGQIPLVLFVLSAIFIYYNSIKFNDNLILYRNTYVCVFISLLGFYVRFLAIGTTPAGTSGRNTQQQVAEQLNNLGIYSTVRHPLYLGNYLIWLGIVLYTGSFSFTIIFSLLFWLYYERIMMAEEDFLFHKFGNIYKNWVDNTPAFIPSFKNYRPNTLPFSYKAILRREYSGVLATAISFAYVDFCVFFFNQNIQDFPKTHFITIFISAFLSLILKLIRKKTNILNEMDRS